MQNDDEGDDGDLEAGGLVACSVLMLGGGVWFTQWPPYALASVGLLFLVYGLLWLWVTRQDG